MTGESLSYPLEKNSDVDGVQAQQGIFFSWAFLFVIFAFPVSSYLSEFAGIGSNILSIAARAVSMTVVMAYLGFLLHHGLFKPVNEFYLFLAFWLIYSCRILYDTTFHDLMLGRSPYDYFFFAFILSLLGAVPFFVPVKIPFDRLAIRSWMVLVFLNTVGLYNNLKADNLFAERLGGNERLNPITYGMLAALLFVVSIVLLLQKKRPSWLFGSLIASSMLGIANLFIAASKSPFLFAGLSAFILFIYYLRQKQFKQVFVLGFVFVLAGAIVFRYGLQEYLTLALDRFTDIGEDTSSQDRTDMVSGAINQFLESPVFGSFLEEKTFKEYPHNLVLESFMATGILGGLLFVIYYLRFLWVTMRNIFRSRLSVITFIAFSALVLSFFSGGLSFSSDFWIDTAIMFAMNAFFAAVPPRGEAN